MLKFNLCYSVVQIVIFTRIICPRAVTMSLSDDAMASLSVLEGDVGMIKRVAFSILSSGTSEADDFGVSRHNHSLCFH